MTEQSRWCKSSYSAQQSDCVELSARLDAVRDSKDPGGPALRVDISAFVRAVKGGRFDR